VLKQCFSHWLRTETKAPCIADILGLVARFRAKPAKPPLLVVDNRSFPPIAADADELKRRQSEKQQAKFCLEFPMLKQIPRVEP